MRTAGKKIDHPRGHVGKQTFYIDHFDKIVLIIQGFAHPVPLPRRDDFLNPSEL